MLRAAEMHSGSGGGLRYCLPLLGISGRSYGAGMVRCVGTTC